MVSKASDDLPDPDRPVMTVRLWRGMVTSTFFRLCTRAPNTCILSFGSNFYYLFYMIFLISFLNIFAQQIHVSLERVFLSVSTFGFDIDKIYTHFHGLAMESTVPSGRRVAPFIELLSPSVVNDTTKFCQTFI